MVTLTLLRTDVPDEAFERLASVLCANERERAARFRLPEDRQRYMVTRASLRHLLAHQLGLDARSLAFGQIGQGKPVLAPADANGNTQSPLHFNVSHSGQWAAIAWGRHPVGVDIEQRRSLDVLAVGGQLFDADELEKIARADDAEAAFFLAWTAREALLKAHGTGLGGTDVPPAQAATMAGPDSRAVAPVGDVCIEHFEVAPDYYGAVCVLAPSMTLTRHVAVDPLHPLPTLFIPG